MVGPPLGGFIVSVLSWKYIFLINVPIGIITFFMGIRILPRANSSLKEKLDLSGSVLLVAVVVTMFGSITQGQNIGYNNSFIILGFIIAILCLIIFISVEKRKEAPLLQLSIFENRLFSLSIFCGFISFISISCSSIIQPFYLQDVIKLSPSTTGIFMMIYPLILSVVAPVSGYLSDKIGSEFLTFLGLMFTGIGLYLMSTLNEYSTLAALTTFIAIMSIGNGLFQSPNNSLIMSTVPKNKLGIAGSINALVRNLGMVVGISLSTTLLYSMMSYKAGRHVVSYIEGRDDLFVYGMRYVYITAAIICASGAALTAFRLYSSKAAKRKSDSLNYN
jgi:MFS family permease